MELAVSAIALVVAVVSLSAAINFGRAQRTLLTDVAALRTQLDQTRRELGELKAAAEAVPDPPPLPRTRPGGLDDLRQQLRAAHSEPEEPTDT